MRRYKFKLESVLKYRRVVEELRLQAFASVQGELISSDRRLAANRAECARALAERSYRLDLEDRLRREAYVDSLNAAHMQEERVREGIVARLEDARANLIQARQARETMERIRRHDYADYLRAANKAEQETLDELAALRHGRSTA